MNHNSWTHPTGHGPDFTCNFPQTVLRPIETDQSQIYPKCLLCFDSHLLVNISRCSSQHLSVISSKHCLCLQLELRQTRTAVRLKNPDYLGLKTQTLPDHSLKNARWVLVISFYWADQIQPRMSPRNPCNLPTPGRQFLANTKISRFFLKEGS